ncbi:MAG: ABC transporter ATP-binding protein [Deltaproteobacteria bacterium]|nr:ABC transporter ATP-binding protein [Deltaproteobacteria bacterium]
MKKKRGEYAEICNSILNSSFSEEQFVVMLFLGVVAVFLIRCIFILMSYYFEFRLSEMLKAEWQIKIFNKYLNQEYEFFLGHHTGDLVQRQMVHTENAGCAVLYSCQVGKDFFISLFLYAMLWAISIKATLVVTFVMIILTFISIALSKLKIYVLSQEHARLQKDAYSTAFAVIAGIRQVKVFLGENFFKNRFSTAVRRKALIIIKNNTLAQAANPLIQTIVCLGIIFSLFYATRYSGDVKEFIPMLVVFGGAVYRISGSLAGIYGHFMQLANVLPSVNIVSELLMLKDDVKDLHEINRFSEGITFQDVSFSYPQKKDKVLKNINIHFGKGNFYGVVGPSGSGKSTLVDLIIKFYSPNSGRILIDNKSLDKVDTRSWMKQVGLVSQETFIFNGTIEQNISFAKDEWEIDGEQMVMAAKVADIHDFIQGLPKGYKTEVGEMGLRLSGGQRQRLAIARAVYRDPDIYIFDEATSSLDTHSEEKIQKSIEELSRTKTVIAIAHRLSTVVNADEILVMNRGEIIERGAHLKLLKNSGFYSELFIKQTNNGYEKEAM